MYLLLFVIYSFPFGSSDMDHVKIKMLIIPHDCCICTIIAQNLINVSFLQGVGKTNQEIHLQINDEANTKHTISCAKTKTSRRLHREISTNGELAPC
jgi:hypothetical protein